MHALVTNREKAEATSPDPRTAVVSISGMGEPARLRCGWGPVLRLRFQDVTDREAREDATLVPMTPDQAAQLVEFVDGCLRAGIVDFLVHCDAGVSRSVAVGRWMEERCGARVRCTEVPDDFSSYNHLVYRLLREEDG